MCRYYTGVFVAILAVILYGYLSHLELKTTPEVEYACRMAESAKDNIAAEDDTVAAKQPLDKTAFVVGYTGATGKALVAYLDENRIFKKVRLIGRKKPELNLKNADLFEQVEVDFDKLEDYSDVFKDASIGYCSLGTTRAKSGYHGYIKVDYDYTLKVGELAKAGGCQHFSLVSSQGANKNSTFLYMRTKGQVEEALKVFHFDRFSVFRPAGILADRDQSDSRKLEAVAKFVIKPITTLFPTFITIPVESLAKAMVVNSLATSTEAFELFENKPIHKLAGDTCTK